MKLSRWQSAQLRWAHDPRAKARGGFWLTLLFYVATFVLSELLRPKPKIEDAKPAGLGDFRFPTATEERFVPLLWGTVQITGPNVVWWGGLVQEPIIEEARTGLFSKMSYTKGFRYYLGVQSALCRGEVDSLLRVWIGDDLVGDYTGAPITHGNTFTINEPTLFGGEQLGQGGVVGTLQFFAGTSTQAVSTFLADYQQIGPNNKTPAYRGTCHITPSADPVYVGTSSSVKAWKYELQRIPNGLGLSGSGKVNTYDANPINVLYEVLTDADWGLAIDASKIDTTSFTAAGDTCATEGNGFSYLLDSQLEAAEIIALIEEQVDGVLFFNQIEGKFQITLARSDYVVSSLPSFDDTNIVSFESFARSSWEDTTNFVRSKFNQRSDSYKGTYGLAIDSANIRIQDGAIVTTTRAYPGCKDADLANDLAWRDLRTLAVPLAKARILVDYGSGYDLQPGQPIKVTNTNLGIADLPFRITRVDYGEMTDNVIGLDLIEDVFYYLAASFGAPFDSGWEPPVDSLLPFLTAYTLTFESPRAFNARDPESIGPADNRIWVSARRRGVEVVFQVHTKLDGASESAYELATESNRLIRIGELTLTLPTTGTDPATVNVTATPDSQELIREVFEDGVSLSSLGLNLTSMIMIGNELMLVSDASNNGSTVDLTGVYRGVCDTTRETHTSGTDVWLLTGIGGQVGGVTVGPFAEDASIDLKLLPRSVSDVVDLASATEEEVDMASRSRRPYPPGSVTVGASGVWNDTVSLEQLGGGAESTGFAVGWTRRDYRTGNGFDEIVALTEDAATTFGDFPAANSTVYEVRLYDDPDGSATLLLTYSSLDAVTQNQLRADILRANGGVLPTRMRVEIDASHDDNGDTLAARHTLRHDFDVTSVLSGDFEFGALDNGDISNLYTATVAGTYAFSLSSAFSVGDVEYRLNGGSWTTLISAGGTSGNIAGVAISDTIEVRHLSTDTSVTKQLDLNAAGAGQDGFAILFT